MRRIHPKVKAATVGAALPSLAIAILTWAQDHPDVLTAHVPKVLAGFAVLIIPPLLTFLAGYNATSGPAGSGTPTRPVNGGTTLKRDDTGL